MKTRVNIYLMIALSVTVSSAIIFFFPGKGVTTSVTALLSITSFLFGVFLASAMSNRQARVNSVRKLLRNGDALILSIYKLSAVFGAKKQNECRKLIDDYLITTLDYYLDDYDKSVKVFLELHDFFFEIEPKNRKEEMAYSQILKTLERSLENEKEIVHLLNERMLKYEWGSILSLSLIIFSALFYMNNDLLIYKAIVVILSTAIVLLLLILKDLNDLRWKEQYWVWEPLFELFNEMDLKPYIPGKELFSRIKLKKGFTYRVANYPHPYPDFTDKKIELLEVK